MVEISGIEPLTFPAVNAGKPPSADMIEMQEVSGFQQIHTKRKQPSFRMTVSFGGDKRDRTADLLNAIQALSQLSYTPMRKEYINRRGRECQEEFLKNRKNQEFLWMPQKDEKCTCGAEANAL